LASGSVKVTSNWVAAGAVRWDAINNNINQYVVGAGYVDDCFVLAVNYVRSYNYSVGSVAPVQSDAYMLQIGLRTIGSFSIPLP
jgi:LPS-assembly protein